MANKAGEGKKSGMNWSAKHPAGSKKMMGRPQLKAATTNKSPKQAVSKVSAGTPLKSKTGSGASQAKAGWKTAISGLKGLNSAKGNGLGKAGKGLRITGSSKVFKD